jgi:hypothetical protein
MQKLFIHFYDPVTRNISVLLSSVKATVRALIKEIKTLIVTPKGKFTKISKPGKDWLKQAEIYPFIKLILWATSMDHFKDDFLKMSAQFKFIWDHSGSTFLFKYLKEVLRLTTRKLAGLDPMPSKGIFVKLHKVNGYPRIIPLNLINLILDRGQDNWLKGVIALLSVLSIFRVLPTEVIPNTKTITDEWCGEIKTLPEGPIKTAVENLGIPVFKGLGMRVKGSMKAGPNGKLSLMTSCLDALTFWIYPRQLLDLLKFQIITYGLSGVFFSCWLLTIMIFSLPYFLLTKLFGAMTPVLGRLAVVYDQAGKARVVAISNSWIQMAMFPIHLAIFNFLKRLPMDGTHDQMKCYDDLLSRTDLKEKNQILYGFDLSAATDRLPIEAQQQILDLIGLDGKLWGRLLRIGYWFHTHFVHYSVGQPMGAYSSFAMLALTHHVIVQVAAIKAGVVGLFKDYCVLGDDVVIANDEVAVQYKLLIQQFGMDISEGKSICSSTFTEFAKRLKGYDNLDISPIGAGLILLAVRYKANIAFVIQNLLERSLMTVWSVFHELELLPKEYRRYIVLVRFVVSRYIHNNMKCCSDLREKDLRTAFISWFCGHTYQLVLVHSLINNDIMSELRNSWKSIKQNINRGLFISQSRVGMPDLTELLFLPLLPSTYIIIMNMARTVIDLLVMKLRLVLETWKPLWDESSVDVFELLERFKLTAIIDLYSDGKKGVSKQAFDRIYKISRILDHSLDEDIEGEKLEELIDEVWYSPNQPTYYDLFSSNRHVGSYKWPIRLLLNLKELNWVVWVITTVIVTLALMTYVGF